MDKRNLTLSLGALVLCLGLFLSGVAVATERHPVAFEITQETALGTSVFILGDVPELGGGNPIFAVKLQPYDYPTWRLTVAIPAGTNYQYRFATRQDAAESLADPTNITYLTDWATGATPPPATPVPSLGKTIHYHSGWQTVYLVYLENGQTEELMMTDVGPGREPEERRYAAVNVSQWDSWLSFRFRNAGGDVDKPPDAEYYESPLHGLFVQDGQIFNYLPPATVSEPELVIHEPFHSSVLDNDRAIRVLLPRGYSQNVEKQYPVLYMHDGQNIFVPGGPFGCWYVDVTSEWLIRMGHLRETIIIGVDNMGEERMREYTPDYSGGIGDLYASFLITELKPFIDTTYRTLPDALNTSTSGSSMGGLISAYLAWEYPGSFHSAGCLSSSFWRSPELVTIFETEAKPDVWLYLDSGNAGTSYDGMWGTWSARDALIHNGFVLDADVKHYIFYGAEHNEAAWAARVHIPLLYMLDIRLEPNPLDPDPSSSPTPQPTSTPTPDPSSAPTLTPTPTRTSTPPGSATPTGTATAVNTPTATPTAAGTPGLTLWLEHTSVTVGDRFWLMYMLHNSTANDLELDVYILLSAFGSYWSWPSWASLEERLDYHQFTVAGFASHSDDVLNFIWPEGVGSADGLAFYGASFHENTFELFGALSVIDWRYY